MDEIIRTPDISEDMQAARIAEIEALQAGETISTKNVRLQDTARAAGPLVVGGEVEAEEMQSTRNWFAIRDPYLS